jgi:hypothetical protein
LVPAPLLFHDSSDRIPMRHQIAAQEQDRRRDIADPTSAAALPPAAALPSITTLGPAEWERLFPGSPEDHDLFRAYEAVPPPDTSLGVFTVREDSRLVAAAPGFHIAYRLDTPFQGRLRQTTDRLCARYPSFLRLKVVGLGSPLSDNSGLGFDPGLDPADRRLHFAGLLGALAREADRCRADIIAVKSLGAEADEFHELLTAAGYGRLTSVPVVVLPLPFVSRDHYLSSLPSKTAAYLRRKMRGAAGIRIEYRDSTAGLDEDLNRLLEETLSQSGVDHGDLEEVHPAFFREVKVALGDRARLMLCWRGDELLSFQLFLVGRNRIIASKIGMKYPAAREHNLYFVNWMEMIDYAIAHGIGEIEMGATAYSAKLLFGGHLERRWIYFRFRNRVVNRLVRPLAPLFDFERNDPELRRLNAEASSRSPAGGDGKSNARAVEQGSARRK